ncbi:hypothetical protein N7G274_010177 [Stereocaulon virgatum]|uniref:Uncharacterized protein n=1 Tax=Stereocaulon virgatum TaxID=373712 RepID=A0ABR3ZWD7_9LECA
MVSHVFPNLKQVSMMLTDPTEEQSQFLLDLMKVQLRWVKLNRYILLQHGAVFADLYASPKTIRRIVMSSWLENVARHALWQEQRLDYIGHLLNQLLRTQGSINASAVMGTQTRSETIQAYVDKLPSLRANVYEDVVTGISHMVDKSILKSGNFAFKDILSISDPPLVTPGSLVGIGPLSVAERIRFFMETINTWEDLQSADYDECTDVQRKLRQISANVKAAIIHQPQYPHAFDSHVTASSTKQCSLESMGSGGEVHRVPEPTPLDPALQDDHATALPTFLTSGIEPKIPSVAFGYTGDLSDQAVVVSSAQNTVPRGDPYPQTNVMAPSMGWQTEDQNVEGYIPTDLTDLIDWDTFIHCSNE